MMQFTKCSIECEIHRMPEERQVKMACDAPRLSQFIPTQACNTIIDLIYQLKSHGIYITSTCRKNLPVLNIKIHRNGDSWTSSNNLYK